jgi:hypothetical protein
MLRQSLFTPDAGAQEHAEDPEATSASWETGSAPSLPSVDSQHDNVSFRAGLGCFDTDVALQGDIDSAIGSFTDEFVPCLQLRTTCILRNIILSAGVNNQAGHRRHHYDPVFTTTSRRMAGLIIDLRKAVGLP